MTRVLTGLQTIARLRLRIAALLLGGLLLPPAGWAQRVAGDVVIARGAVTAHVEGRTPRLLGPRSKVNDGEVLSTGPKSLAVINFVDGTRIALRPETVFKVDKFDATEGRENALLRLFRGGFRAVTGYLSKRRRNAMRVVTPVATIGIRGTELDVRLCKLDCAVESVASRPAVGRIALKVGDVQVRDAGGTARPARSGLRLRNGDEIDAGSWSFAVASFRDGTRVTVTAGSAFRVDQVRYDKDQPGKSRGLFSLIKGGIRMLTGAIARDNRRGFRLRTPVATIGIRGTNFDLLCVGSCVSPPGGSGSDRDGLAVTVRDGAIDFDDTHVINAGDTVFLANSLDVPIPIPQMPRTFDAPIPDSLPELPSGVEGDTDPPEDGLYVSCYSGECDVQTDDTVVNLSDGEAGWVAEGGGGGEKLAGIPDFQADDPILRLVDPAVGEVLNLLDDPGTQDAFSCRI